MDAPKKPAHIHEKHRERMRNLFLQSGLDGFSDHNILELLLFYTIPQRDTNETAHELINTFGSLQGVLDAPVEELVKVKGIGMYSAVFLSMLPQVAKRYSSGKLPNRISITDKDALYAYVQSLFIGKTTECAYLLSFGTNGLCTCCSKISTGTLTKLHLDCRSLLEAAFHANAVYAVLAHNHPDGVAAPSSEDIATTRKVMQLFSRTGIQLVDHIIIAGNEYFSMEKHARYKSIFV